MYPRTRIAAALLGMALLLHGISQGAGANEAVTLEMEFDAHENTRGDYMAPVVTHEESIYTVWVDSEQRTMIARKTPDGAIDTNVIFEHTRLDLYHAAPSVGIDRDGYIHVAGNMHNSPYLNDEEKNPHADHAWQYAVSDEPGDVSSFTFRGDDPDRAPPGTWISYPYFVRCREGVLYVAFRHRVKFGTGWSPGIMASGVAKYDADARTWTMVGGTDYEHGEKTTIWIDKEEGSAYQGLKTRVFFCRDNRMHLTWAGQIDGEGGGHDSTHIVYATSGDGGETFRRASGEPIASLPITFENGDVVTEPPESTRDGSRLYNLSHVGVTAEGRPVVSFRNTTHGELLSFWFPEEGWRVPEEFPAGFPARFVATDDGALTAVGSGSFHRTLDGGQTWSAIDAPTGTPQNCIFDTAAPETPGLLRYQALFMDGETGVVRVYTLDLNGPDAP